MSGTCVHIVGAGLAGLSCAVHVKQMGGTPIVYEATKIAGGRVRSVQGQIAHDNGTHLMVGAYHHLFEYLDMINARDHLIPLPSQAFKMVEGDQEWVIRASHFLRDIAFGHVPGVQLYNIFGKTGVRRILDPLALAIFNAPYADVSMRLMISTVRTLLKSGPDAMRPYFAKTTLYDALIQPALTGVNVQYGERLVSLTSDRLLFRSREVTLNEGVDKVVLALPCQAYKHMKLPFELPDFECRAIANIHFYLPVRLPQSFFGLVGTKSQWVFVNGRHVCVTISDYQETDNLVAHVWDEIKDHLGLSNTPQPDHRVIVEKFATPYQDAKFQKMRPQHKTADSHIFLAGDFVQTGLPATIESAILSGKTAAKLALG